MAADVFMLMIMLCKDTPSVDTCTVVKKEFPHQLVSAAACESLFQQISQSSGEWSIKGHRCAKLGDLFPGMKLTFAPSPTPAPAPAPTPETQQGPGGDPSSWRRM